MKTGTSQAYHDNWTIGYTRDVTVGVWVGNFDRPPLRNSTGVTGAAPIFHAVMLAAQRRAGEIEQPLTSPDSLLTSRDICALSGEPANQWCPVRRREWLPATGDDRRRAAGITRRTRACSWSGRRNSASGRASIRRRARASRRGFRRHPSG